MIKVVLVDDDPIVLHGMSMIVEAREDLALMGTAEDGMGAVKLCREIKPDVTVLDIRMPDMDGIEVTKVILREELSSPLLLTTFDEPELIERALQAGAKGYILKNSPAERIVSAIKTVAEGGTVFAPDIVDYIRGMTRNAPQDFFSDLTHREKDIVELIAQGFSNSQIAEELYLSNGTVRNYISGILEKKGLEHRTQIAVKYYLDDRS